MLAVDADRLLAGCDESQRAAITSVAAPLLVIAGAGSGKTRVLTRRIAFRVVNGDAASGHVLALTFTRKAAAELRERLRGLGLPSDISAGTFHALALAQLRTKALDEGREPPTVLASKARLIGRLLSAAEGGFRRRDIVATVAAEIEWAKARRVPPERYVAEARLEGRSVACELEAVASLYERYEVEKRRAGVVDFDDLLELLASAIIEERSFAAVQRWRFRHLFVDELQDANAAQLRLLDAWLGAGEDLFAVGDARQAIYGWNGADRSVVTDFRARYPGAEVIELSTNYRSSPQVVAVASAVFRKESYSQLAAAPDGLVPEVTAYKSDAEEATGVASALRRRRPAGEPWSACAVLTRTNAQLDAFEEALEAARIPYRSHKAARLSERPTVQAALSTLGRDGGSERFLRWLADLSAASSTGDDDLGALLRAGEDYTCLEGSPSAGGFRLFLRESLAEGPLFAEGDGIDLLTFHRAKGLEWPIVFVAGVEAGYLPIAHARTEAAVEEERRLFYVALSRATRELYCSWAQRRSFGGRAQRRQPSPFLAAVEEACEDAVRARRFDVSKARSGLGEARSALGLLTPPS